MLKKILIIIFTILFCCSMRKIGGEFCYKADPLNLSKIQLYDTLERFSEYFNFKENCWTSEQIITDEYFQMDIPLRDDDIKMHIEFRYGRIQKMECFAKTIKIPCEEMEHPNLKLTNNLEILRKYSEHTR